MNKKVLVIDDEPGHRLMVRAVMEDAGWEVLEAASGEEGVAVFAAAPDVGVVLVDMKMPGMDGQQTLKAIHAHNAETPVILLTAYGTVGSAVEAMKQGAFDYLTKPADNDELVLTLGRAWEYSRLLKENDRLRSQISGEAALGAIVGTSAAIKKVHELIRQAGPSEATVLITGESGTGKELIAEALHASSPRAGKNLVRVNCAALPGQLLESELFGYQRGAFTGAVKDKPGRFQLADGGTLFLDEIGEIPLDLQAKLLRAIQERVIEPLGSVSSKAVDVRILAATNRDLRKSVADGSFREDLFFRLNVLEIHSPPLRGHLEDLPVLVSHLLQTLARKNRKNIRGVSPAFLQVLSGYSWPGNVRELENMLERALILSRSDILGPDSLPPIVAGLPPFGPDSAGPSGEGSLGAGSANRERLHEGDGKLPSPNGSLPHRGGVRDFAGEERGEGFFVPGDGDMTGSISLSPFEEAERAALIRALKANSGHREKTADALGISRRTLQYKLKKFGLRRRG